MVALTDPLIRAREATLEGWLQDLEAVTLGGLLYNRRSGSWAPVSSEKVVADAPHVHGAPSSLAHDSVANEMLLDRGT